MSHINRTTPDACPIFHPASHYDSPTDVLDDTMLASSEKRVILSSWASDMYAVESCPWLRRIPGIDRNIPLSDILAALRELDDEDDPPPRGGVAMRMRPPPERVRAFGSAGRPRRNERPGDVRCARGLPGEAAHASDRKAVAMMVDDRSARIRAARSNIRRYRRLLETDLTELERQFVRRRLSEESSGLQALSAGILPSGIPPQGIGDSGPRTSP